eukprot:gene11801-35186_t
MGYIAASIVASAVTIDVEHASRTIPAATLGCHYSPLDHQLYYVYSQMMYDESFEQSLGGTEKEGEGDTVSLGWVNISSPQHVYNATNTAAAATSPSTAAGNSISWTSDPADAFNGNASVVLEIGGGGGGRGKRGGVEVGRVGVGGRGLYHQGFALAAGKEYRGYLAVKSAAAADVTVALEDWDADPSQPPQAATAGNYTVAQTTVHHSGDGRWAVLPFTLTPIRATACKPFPYGTPPLDCGIPRSQSKFPPSESAECVV